MLTESANLALQIQRKNLKTFEELLKHMESRVEVHSAQEARDRARKILDALKRFYDFCVESDFEISKPKIVYDRPDYPAGPFYWWNVRDKRHPNFSISPTMYILDKKNGFRKHAKHVMLQSATCEFHNAFRGFLGPLWINDIPLNIMRCLNTSLEVDAKSKYNALKEEQAQISKTFSDLVAGFYDSKYQSVIRQRIKQKLESHALHMIRPKDTEVVSSPEQLIHVIRFFTNNVNKNTFAGDLQDFIKKNRFGLSIATDEDLREVANMIVVRGVMRG